MLRILELNLPDTVKLMDVSIWRGDKSGGAYEQFEVTAQDSQTILDVVSWVQQNQDPSLTYCYACRVGMCGSCAMMVSDTPRWICRTHVKRCWMATS